MKKRRFLLPSALLGALLFAIAPALATPVVIDPTPGDVGFDGPAGTDTGAAVAILAETAGPGTGTAAWFNADTDAWVGAGIDDTETVFDIRSFIINEGGLGAVTDNRVAIFTDRVGVDFTIGNFNVIADVDFDGGTKKAVFGFLADGGAFIGSIMAGNITVQNVGDGNTEGFVFLDGAGNLDLFDGFLDMATSSGTLTVTANNGMATGLFASGLGSNAALHFSDIVVAGTHGSGIVIGWGAGVDGGAILEFDRIQVTGTGTGANNGDVSAGIAVVNGAFDASGSSIGEIYVSAHSDHVAGITVSGSGADIFGLLLTRDITVIGGADSLGVIGINSEGVVELIIDGTVTISATHADDPSRSVGIMSGDDTWIELIDGANLTVSDVLIDGTLWVGGEGTADLGAVMMDNDNDVFFGDFWGDGDKTTILLDFARTSMTGSGNEIGDNVTLITYGEVTLTDWLDPNTHESSMGAGDGAGRGPGTVFVDVGENFVHINESIFSNFRFDRATGTLWMVGHNNDAANMNDGFLVATLMHQRYTGLTMVNPHFISAQPRRNGFLGQAWCDPCAPVACDPCAPAGFRRGGRNASGQRAAWVNYVGRTNTYAGWEKSSDWKMGIDGVQVGSDVFRTKNAQLGVIFGYEGGWATSDGDIVLPGQDRLNSDNIYLGLYGARVLRNGVDVRFVYNHGWQDFDMTRRGWESSFKGRTNEINLELGRRIHSGAWSLRPFGGLDFHITRLNATEEFGEPVGVVSPRVGYDKMNMTQMFLRSGFELNYQRNRFGFNSGLAYAYEVNRPNFQARVIDVTNATDLRAGGVNHSALLTGSKMGRELLTVNVGGSYLIGRNFTAFGGYDMQAVVDRSGGVQHAGHVGGSFRW